MRLRKLERFGLWVMGISIVVIPIGLYAKVPFWGFWLLVWCAEMITAPMLLAAYSGWNPYAPKGWQKYCSTHKYTYYVTLGCHYCAKDNV